MKRLMSVLSLLPLLTLAAQAAPAAGWLTVGDSLPAASVRSETGAALTLQDSAGGRPTVLIFYRGGWCPFCTRHLAALAEAAPELQAAGFQLLAISPDQPAKLRARPSHEKLPYTLLSDSEMKAAQACGIAFKVDDALVAKYKNDYGIDLERDSGQTHHLLPHPAVFIVDHEGVVRFAHVNPDYKVRMSPGEIVAAARGALATKD